MSILLCAAFGNFSQIQAAEDASQIYLNAYQEYMQAEQMERNGSAIDALTKYKDVVKTLRLVRQNSPEWQAEIVQFRLDKAQKSVERLENAVPVKPTVASPQEAASSVPDETPSASSDQGPTVTVVAPTSASSDVESSANTGRGRTKDLMQENKILRSQMRELKDKLLQAEAEKKSVMVASERGKVESAELKSVAVQLKEELSNLKGDASQQDRGNAKNLQEITKLRDENKKLAAEYDALDDDYQSAFAKLERAAKYISVSDTQREQLLKERNEAAKQKNEALQKVKSIKDNSKEVERVSSENKSLVKKLATAEDQLNDAEQKFSLAEKQLKKLSDNKKDAEKLAEDNHALTEKLSQAEKQIKNAGENKKDVTKLSDENHALSEKLAQAEKKLSAADENAKEMEKLSADNKSLSDKLTQTEKKITELGSAGGEKEKVIADIQSELNGVKDQLVANKTQMEQKEKRITSLEKQLDETAGDLASIRLNPPPSAEEKRAHEENELLRGIVLRQINEQDKRVKARKMIEDEMQRLQVKSTTLEEQLASLGNETLLQTKEEKSLFKNPQAILTEKDDKSLSVTVAVAKSDATTTPDVSVAPNASPSSTPDISAPVVLTADTGTNSSTSATPGSGASSSSTPSATPSDKKPSGNSANSKGPEALPSELEPQIQQAKELFSRGNFPEADKIYLKILEAAPDNYYALANYGVTEFQLGRLAAAEVALRKAAGLNKKDSFAFTILGIVHYQQKRYDEAMEVLRKAIDINPKDYSAHNYLGITLSNKGDRTGAEQEIEKAIILKPDYADAHFNLAVIYATDDPPRKDLAKREYNKAVELGAAPDPALEQLTK
ncbi:MAG: tetratricopeptide repeat protein [Chthoniobacterales bacterium]